MDVEAIRQTLANRLEYSAGKDLYTATPRDWFSVVSYTVRDRLIERWMETMRTYYREDTKRVYYLSLEFLTGRALINSLLNLGVLKEYREALDELGLELDEIVELEPEAALGNGGLGRLAACFLDSMATLGLPGYGYGIRYEYGMFNQRIEHGNQVEHPDNWLRYGNPWEFARPEMLYPVRFFGRVVDYVDEHGKSHFQWVDGEEVLAMAYDTPVPGYGTNTVNNMRLWASKSSRDFDLKYFNDGDYIRAVQDKSASESISKVLYPDDTTSTGRGLRLKQEYFFVSASLQDILARFHKKHDDIGKLPDKVAIQLNDTHPAIAIPELMRLLVDKYNVPWERAWDITQRTFSYTNHTLLPEALETWPVALFEVMLPRHLQIIFEINHHFLRQVIHRHPGDFDLLRRMSIIHEDGEQRVRMAHLAIVGSHKVNGVAALHTHLLKTTLFSDFEHNFPGRIVNKTNGITPRLWLNQANPPLTQLISSHIGSGWLTNLDELRKLAPLAEDRAFRAAFRAAKRANKERLARLIQQRLGIEVNIDSLFDVQVKRIHEYKRQLLNVLHVITLYNRIRANGGDGIVPRTVVFGGKAAPAYAMAKLIIKLINDVADVVNNDPNVRDRLKVVFIPNYNVSTALDIIPAADLSEQISTAGTEASGTGNMKFALNGALTIGTLDGANVEIREEVGADNIFIFGLTTEEVRRLRSEGYRPWDYYHANSELRQALDMIGSGFFSADAPALYHPIIHNLLDGGDHYLLLADYASYVACQEQVAQLYGDQEEWTRKAILNTAGMGKFSSDRTIREYAEEVWNVAPVEVTLQCPI
ncbi:MAG: glycogen/starch/alpha-glucan phosphorylase [Gammaproteobacteria bacterium]|nr:glycogen/starch/alpha-glucan phosphorylase [Gammaproteobacteria bacterium]